MVNSTQTNSPCTSRRGALYSIHCNKTRICCGLTVSLSAAFLTLAVALY